MKPIIRTTTFRDFSPTLPKHWEYQCGNPSNDDVSVYLIPEKGVWCREVKNVRVREIDGWLVPEPNQIITYPQKIND